jgi:exodeoxyribonuclease VII large subunit
MRPMTPEPAAFEAPRRLGATVWHVQALLLAVADALQARFGAVDVQGEIASFTRAASGHCYFSLKDGQHGDAALRCVMFKRAASMVPFAPREGQIVRLRGRLTVYEARGDLQFVVESMAMAGEGALHEQLARLKAALQAQGLFDGSRKRELPRFAQRVAVVTSLQAAALHDVATALARRAPHVELIVVPTLVQGAGAPELIVQAMQAAAAFARVDVVLLVRGGGSLEDLWAFNDERVVRAVVACPVPVVVGVGHESDITLADLAADVRAATPTAAAELCVATREAARAELQTLALRVHRNVHHRLESHAARLDRAAMQASRPAHVVQAHHQRLALLQARALPALRVRWVAAHVQLDRQTRALKEASARRHVAERARLATLAARLDALNPQRTLARGFAWLTSPAGLPITSVAGVTPGATITAALADGTLDATVNAVAHKP